MPRAVSYHGDTREDEYAWLRDDNWQAVMKNPDALAGDIRAHLEAENVYTDTIMQPTQELQDALFEEMRGRIEEDDASVPVTIGNQGWATRYRKDGEHALVCWVNPTRMSKTCRSRLMEISKPQAVIISNWPPIHHHLTDRCWHGVMTTRVRNISQSACAYLPMVKMVTHNFWTQPARAAGQPTTNFCFMWLSMKIIVRIRSCATGWAHTK